LPPQCERGKWNSRRIILSFCGKKAGGRRGKGNHIAPRTHKMKGKEGLEREARVNRATFSDYAGRKKKGRTRRGRTERAGRAVRVKKTKALTANASSKPEGKKDKRRNVADSNLSERKKFVSISPLPKEKERWREHQRQERE